jgi:hypothetical protein
MATPLKQLKATLASTVVPLLLEHGIVPEQKEGYSQLNTLGRRMKVLMYWNLSFFLMVGQNYELGFEI